MASLKRLYFHFFMLVYMLYAFFNKGIAYSYLTEVTLVLGILLILWNIRSYQFAWDKRMALLVIFMALSVLYIFRGIAAGYPVMEVIRDSVIFNYILFAFIVYFFREELPWLKQRLFAIYKWFPAVMCCLFLLSSYVPFLRDLEVFGGQRLFLYKFGDMGVHLFIASIFLLNGNIVLSKRYFVLQWVLIIYLFLIVFSYSRSGGVSYMAAMGVFLIYTKNHALRKQVFGWLKFAPLFIILALPLYLSTHLEENFQGRTLSLQQLQQNAVSIFSSADDGTTLSDNKVWRLVWWAKIIDYTFFGEYFMAGRGLGMSLAASDEIGADAAETDLRSPHSFHLTVLARFGVPVFLLWLYWMFLHLKAVRRKNMEPFLLVLLVITLAFLVNASFDVFLEGPMGAMPFWVFVGLVYAEETFTPGMVRGEAGLE
jgi:hypothetical protein